MSTNEAVNQAAMSFLKRALQKILSERDTKKSQHTELRSACEAALEAISAEIDINGAGGSKEVVDANSPMPPPKAEDKLVNADKYFHPFRLACESKSPRIIRTALDCLQKLMAYGHINGNMLAEVEGFPDAMRLVDLIVDTVCRCFVGDATDEGVQLQIIKALLTAVTSNTCDVHEGTLLKAVRTCYNIYLASKNLVNQRTAKAGLTQMLSVIFQRMESLHDNPKFKPSASRPTLHIAGFEPGSQQLSPQDPTQQDELDESQLSRSNISLSSSVEVNDNDNSSGINAETTGPDATAINNNNNTDADSNSLAEHLENQENEFSSRPSTPVVGSTDSVVDIFVRGIVDQAVAQIFPDAPPSEAPKGKYGVCVNCGKEANYWCSTTTKPVCSLPCKQEHLAKYDPVKDEMSVPGLPAKDTKFGHVYRKDAFLVFRSMCKLSMKQLPDKDVVDAKSHELRSKILSLELQLSILQNAGKGFKSDPLFIDAVQQYLCVALSRNGVSHVPAVFELSLAIFLTLLQSFKQHLKMQIEVFFKEILLSMLEISTSSFQHKWLVVVCLSKICKDAQTVIDIYLNYDCDEFLTNIFERMINDLAKVAQGRAASELGATPAQEHNMKVMGLKCLVSIMRCLVKWTDVDEDNHAEEEDKTQTPVTSKTPTPSLNSQEGVNEEESKRLLEESRSNISEISEFEERKLKKEIREMGIELFNKKPRKGIQFMIEKEMIEETPESVAQLLSSDSRLDKTQIGEYLGENKPFCVEVMHAYVDMLDMSSCKTFLDSLRLFLQGFRLPGEAQKIDRLMEKFAQRYCEVHPDNGLFASADAAYVLAFSVIMLTTDLHSTHIKNKMTKEEFVRNNRGINDNKNLPPEYLEAIYEAIKKEEIKMKGHQSTRATPSELLNVKRRAGLFQQEIQSIGEIATEQMKLSGTSQSVFMTATHVEHVRPMFKVAWTSLMAAFTVPLKNSDDPDVIAHCLEGLRSSIHIACIFGMELETNAFVQSLAKFTNLGSNLQELKLKHVEAIRTLLQCAIQEGNYLGDSWKDILTCVSLLHRAQLLSSDRQRKGSEAVSETASQSIVVAVDKIFTQSRALNGEAIVDFVRWLCAVSMEELQLDPPITYSLSKMADIAHYNMDRIKLEWAHMWAIMGDYYNKVGCMANKNVSSIAVDSLRQLSKKFLEIGELANYSFQKDFLRPFEYVMNHNKDVSTRDLVVSCLAQMVQGNGKNIRSGWKNIFFVFSLAASDNVQDIVHTAFSTTTLIFDEHFSLIATCFMDAVNCLAEFACNPYYPDISMEAIKHLRSCANHVAKNPQWFVSTGDDSTDEPKIWVKGWFPVLFGLSRIVNRCKLDVRTRGLTVMFEIMKTYGGAFLPQWWKDLFRVVFRIFDNNKLQTMQSEQEKMEWMNTTCNHALRSVVDVISQYFDTLQDVLLKDMFNLLSWCIKRNNEQLARAGTECLHILVMNNGFKFTDDSWQVAIGCITDLFEQTCPQEMMNFSEDEIPLVEDEALSSPDELDAKNERARKLQSFFNAVIIKCVIQLELIQTVEWIVLSSTLPTSVQEKPDTPAAQKPAAPSTSETSDTSNQAAIQHRDLAKAEVLAKEVDTAGELMAYLTSPRLLALLKCLENSHDFARSFNLDLDLRSRLWKAGFMKNRSKPNLLKQETTSLSCALRILFRIYGSEDRKDVWEPVEERIHALTTATLEHFFANVGPDTRAIWTPIIVLIIREFLALSDERFQQHAARHYQAMIDLLSLSYDSPLAQLGFMLGAFFNRARRFEL
eukprot:m.119519 g.119519  ORF g.119519 m.119519 type:complete len:1767 (+) comp23182_c0_seq1:115-5415(+)